MKCKIVGYECNILEVILEPQECFYAERGALVYMDEGLSRVTETIGSSALNILSSKLAGESVFLVHYTNVKSVSQKLVVSGQRLGLCPIKITLNDHLVIKKGAYVASTTKVDISFDVSFKKWMSGIGATFQTITGNATVFVDTIGMPIICRLNEGQTIVVDETHLLALLNIDDNRITTEFSARNVFQGEGLRTTKITGPGIVYLMPV